MKKYSFFLVVYTIGLLLAYSSTYALENRVFFTGSIQFPRTIKDVPAVRVYWAGNKIECITAKNSKTLSFDIPGLFNQRGLYMVIAKDIRHHKLPDNNVIWYQYLDPKTPYKFYYLERSEQLDASMKKIKSFWKVKELQLLVDDNGNFRLPDEAIIIYYYAHLIAGLEGGHGLELPTIKIVPNIFSIVGSERSLRDMSDALLCSALTMDTVHRELDKEIRPSHDQKTIITITT